MEASGHTLVVACPGSGKTRTLVAKAARSLMRDQNRRVRLLTFTREAAGEMRSRILPLLTDGVDEARVKEMSRRLVVGTFHSTCSRSLSEAGVSAGSHLFSPGEEWMYYQRTADACAVTAEQVARVVERIKTDPAMLGIDAGEAPAEQRTLTEESAWIYQVYTNLLRKNALWDFADLIRETVKGMRTGRVPRWPEDEILVDEYQDTDGLQYELLRLHRECSAVTVVGDDDQGIYSFRHAMGTAGMRRFEEEFNARKITLATNYRSRPEIIRLATRLIENNHERMPKAMQPGMRVRGVEPERCRIDRQYATVLDEASAAVSTLCGFLLEHPDANAAILARTNGALNTVEAEYVERQRNETSLPPLVRLGGGGLAKDKLGALLRSLLNGAARPKTRRGIETIFTHLLGYSYEQVHPAAGAGFAAVINHLNNLKAREAGSGDHAMLHELATTYKAWRLWMRGDGANNPEIIERVCGGAQLWLKGAIERSKKVQGPDKRDIKVLNAIHRRFCSLSGTIPQRLNTMAGGAKSANKTAEGEAQAEVVPPGTLALVTLHGAKGMEFDRAWLIQAAEGIVPHKENPLTDEERRLFYVGVTRAKHWLDVSRDSDATPSQFIAQMGEPGII